MRQKFDGYERDDETGLDFAQARYFSSFQGRFTSVDPLHSSAILDDPQSWNRYIFVGNRPLIYTDPTGLQWGRSQETGEYKWFQSGVVDNGWDKVNIGQEYVAIDDRRVVLLAGGKWDYVRPSQADICALCDSEIGFTIAKTIAYPWMVGLGVLSGGAMGGAAVAATIYDNESQGPLMLGTQPAGNGPEMLKLSDLTPTEVKNDNATTRGIIADIKANGIKEPFNYVEHDGVKYIVDGNTRYLGAQYLGIKEVPAQRVSLPYKGFKTVNDLQAAPMNRVLRPLRWMRIK